MKTLKTFFTLLFSFFFLLLLNAQKWEAQAIGILPLNYGVFDISVVNENVVWAVAFDQSIENEVPTNHITKVLKTTDGGLNWKTYDVEEVEGRISLDIEAFDENIAYITTQDFGNGSGRGVFKTENGGDTWIEKFNNVAGGVWIRFFNDQDGVIINREYIATTQDGGESWQMVPIDDIPSYQDNEFTLISSGNNSCHVIEDHLWFGTSNGRVFRSKDKGLSWEVFNTSLGSSAIISSVAFRDTLNGIAVDVNGTTSSFAKTSDGGETWSNFSSNPEVSISNIEYVPNTDSILIGTSDIFISEINRVSVYSTDFGRNWEIISTIAPFGGTEFITPKIGWTSRGIITSSSQGAMFKWDGDLLVSLNEPWVQLESNIFPNPFKDIVNIQASKTLIEYRLTTIDGKTIQTEKSLNLDNANLNFQHLKSGVYVLELIFEDKTKVAKRVFKAN